MRYILYNLASIASLTFAFILKFNDKGGWGWFLFLAICLSVTVKTRNKTIK